MRPAVLVIAATYSSGGAGLTRDVRVLTDFSTDALCAITAVTAQSDSQVAAVHHVPPQIIRAQIAAALATRRADAIKIGMLGTRATVEAVVESLPADVSMPIVLDPVLVSSSGGVLLDADGRTAMRGKLFPRVMVITPNVPEAAALLDEDMATNEQALIEQAERLLAFGPRAVLIKGGHWDGEEAVDLLVCADSLQRIVSTRLQARSRGTGCALASAISAGLAHGVPLFEACREAKRYVAEEMLGSGFLARSPGEEGKMVISNTTVMQR
ncbi:MAG: hydroxymethylpyrimidine/phosphomethylpyrimidine kinase [Steroidobacteraceae bacterium]